MPKSARTVGPSPAAKKNIFLPGGLALQSDYVLIRSHVEYSHAYALLAHLPGCTTRTVRSQLNEAIKAIEGEMEARSIPVRVPAAKRPPRPNTPAMSLVCKALATS